MLSDFKKYCKKLPNVNMLIYLLYTSSPFYTYLLKIYTHIFTWHIYMHRCVLVFWSWTQASLFLVVRQHVLSLMGNSLCLKSPPLTLYESFTWSLWDTTVCRLASDYTSLASCPFLDKPMGKDPAVVCHFIGMVTWLLSWGGVGAEVAKFLHWKVTASFVGHNWGWRDGWA